METEGRWGRRGKRDSPRRRRRRALWYMVLFTEKQEGGQGGLFREGGKSATILLLSLHSFVRHATACVRPSNVRRKKRETGFSLFLVASAQIKGVALEPYSNLKLTRDAPCAKSVATIDRLVAGVRVTGRRPHGLTEGVFRFWAR